MTGRQRQVLQTIADLRARNGVMPSMREIGAACGGITIHAVACHIAALVRVGAMTGLAGSRPGYIASRGYTITAAGHALLAPHALCSMCGQPVPTTTEATP